MFHNFKRNLLRSSQNVKQCICSLGGAAAPSPRTFHGAGDILSGRYFVVYSGGHIGAEPIRDKQVHLYDTKENMWVRPNIKGTTPKPRHGHLVIVDSTRNRVIVHGGQFCEVI